MGLKASSGNVTALLGKQNAPDDLGYPAGVILVPKGDYFATDTLAKVEANWLDNINTSDSVRWRVLPLQWDIEPTKEDDTYATSSTGNVAFVRAGKTTVKYMVQPTPFVMSQLNNLNGIDWDVYVITSNGFITGWSSDNVKIQPFYLQNFHVEGETTATGSDPASVSITWTYDDPNQWNLQPSFLQPLKDGTPDVWNPRDLKDPKAIASLVSDATISGFTIYLEGYDRVPFSGAVDSDIIIKDSTTGVITAVTTITESTTTPGEYAVTATIPAGSYKIGMSPVGTAGATQGFAGLDRDLQDVTIS